MKTFCSSLIAIIFIGYSSVATAQTLPPGFSISNIASGWTQPVGAAPKGTRLFVWEKGGKVFVCNWNTATQKYDKQTTPVLDISAEVGDYRDFGLIGFALDPNFDSNGLIYLLYVVDRNYLINFGTAGYDATKNDLLLANYATIGRVTRYKTTTNASNKIVADPATRTILLGETKTTGIPIIHQSHGVGSLVFAPDGTLLVSAGDGACYNHTDRGSDGDTYFAQALTDGILRPNENVGAFRAQMINSLNGKILRINPVNGDGISNNPFYLTGSPRAPQSRVWAMGFRNPFRMSMKPNSGSTNPATGDIGEIYIGDVGWNTYEELNIVEKAGTNCGWPIFEGQTINSSYANTNVQNKDELNPLYGGVCTQQYFYFQNLLKQSTIDNNTAVYNPCNNSQPITSTNTNRFLHRRPLLDFQHGVTNARVGIFTGNVATATNIGTPESGVTGVPFKGNCTNGVAWYTGTAFPPEYTNTFFFGEYQDNWLRSAKMKSADVLEKVSEFGSGFSSPVFITENKMDGSLIIIDIAGTNPVRRITYGGSLPPVAKITADKIYGPADLSVNFTGSGSYDPENSTLSYLWNFGDAATSTEANPMHVFSAPANTPKKYVVTLTVKDNMNFTDVDSIIISVNNTPPVVNIISPVKNSKYKIGPDTAYTLQATVTDAEHTDGQIKYEWQTALRHNTHEHAEPVDTNRVTSSFISRIGCNGDSYYWLIKLTVTDAAGLSATDSAKIFPLCPGDVILPVTLTSFSVNAQGSANIVKWATEQEINSKYFTLERSSNGSDFQPINKQATKNLPGQQNYSFADDKYFPGTNYYRLKMIDIDESYSYSKIIKIFNGNGNDDNLHITPNPVLKEFTLTANFPVSGPIVIRITDVSGKVVKQISDNVSRGYMTMQIYQLEKLAPGTYFIEVKQKDYTRSTKFVKLN
ncbi:MAG: PQQ-dependent sugar dehydrogenase [Bacteroidota bacterium]